MVIAVNMIDILKKITILGVSLSFPTSEIAG